MFALLLAAAVTLVSSPAKAEPRGSPANWVRATDLPNINEQSAVTTFDLTLDQTGRATHCTIVVASGSDRLDAAVCNALVKRARFKPATDLSGAPIASVYRDRVVWIPNGYGSNSWSKDPDIVISTPKIVDQLKEVAEVIVSIDENGAVEKCFITESIGRADLDEMACAAARNPNVSQPITDDHGTPIHGVRSYYVGFRSSPDTSLLIR